jgi:hypothetical protein
MKSRAKAKLFTITCKQCNTPVETKYKRKMFCNNRCKCEWHNTRERIRLGNNNLKWNKEKEVFERGGDSAQSLPN